MDYRYLRGAHCGPGPRDVAVTYRQVFAKLKRHYAASEWLVSRGGVFYPCIWNGGKRHDAASEVSVVGDGVV